uniref:Microfibril associated protein 5 n=1 Tax=Gasterosteus aculeatus aculeatus TaxID=481459 RepID=A0AAQ4PBN4_GASAC
MGGFPVVLLLCGLHALTAVAQNQSNVSNAAAGGASPASCREETYPCTRMYSVHRPIKRCIGALCLYSLSRVYVINNEICVRTVCQQDEYLKESGQGGPGGLRGLLIRNAVAITGETPKPGQTRPDGEGHVTTCEDGASQRHTNPGRRHKNGP